MTSPHILYCGDTSLDSAAAYLAGLMTHWGWSFDYIPSDRPLVDEHLAGKHQLFIFSDFPATQASVEVQEKVLQQVRDGAGLLMIGGWESFHGLGGDWGATPISNALPVEISTEDDRRNCDQTVLLRAADPDHASVAGLPWSTRPPAIGGFNQFQPKPGSLTVLEAVLLRASVDEASGEFRFSPEETQPLLVTGSEGDGRTTALATDVAPHWVGPMVDWGTSRVTAQADGAEAVEVGDLYAAFLRSLLEWTWGN